MVQMKFPVEVKYDGEYYSRDEIVDVNETDIEELIEIGGCIVEEIQKPKANTRKARENK